MYRKLGSDHPIIAPILRPCAIGQRTLCPSKTKQRLSNSSGLGDTVATVKKVLLVYS